MSEFYLFPSSGSVDTKLSNINRKYDMTLTKIVKEHRLANGSLRRDLIAAKHNFALSWEWLPESTADVSDSGKGAGAIETLANTDGTLYFRVPTEAGGYTQYEVFVAADSFKKTLANRMAAGTQYYNVSIALQEV